jgi:hypothetical protein
MLSEVDALMIWHDYLSPRMLSGRGETLLQPP